MRINSRVSNLLSLIFSRVSCLLVDSNLLDIREFSVFICFTFYENKALNLNNSVGVAEYFKL